jgi:hypothetical protein
MRRVRTTVVSYDAWVPRFSDPSKYPRPAGPYEIEVQGDIDVKHSWADGKPEPGADDFDSYESAQDIPTEEGKEFEHCEGMESRNKSNNTSKGQSMHSVRKVKGSWLRAAFEIAVVLIDISMFVYFWSYRRSSDYGYYQAPEWEGA